MRNLFITLIMFSLFALISCDGTTNKTDSAYVDDSAKAEMVEMHKWANSIFAELPTDVPAEHNPITNEKVSLGKKLYYDKILSKDITISCNSCHDIAKYGVDQLPTSPGNDGENGTRNSPTTFNAALHISQFWDGREPHVEAQAGGPVLNPVEMAMPDEDAVVARLKAHSEYPALFAAAFPDSEDAITYENMKMAIGAFERKLITPSRFDNYLAGDIEVLNEKELLGMKDFKEAGCFTCHMGSAMGGNMFQKFGIYGDYWEMTKSTNIDEGKFEATQNENDKYIFKVPSLRNIEHTFPYFHDGSVADLGESVKIMAKTELNKDLSSEQIENIVAFLKTLTGEIDQAWLEEVPES